MRLAGKGLQDGAAGVFLEFVTVKLVTSEGPGSFLFPSQLFILYRGRVCVASVWGNHELPCREQARRNSKVPEFSIKREISEIKPKPDFVGSVVYTHKVLKETFCLYLVDSAGLVLNAAVKYFGDIWILEWNVLEIWALFTPPAPQRNVY